MDNTKVCETNYKGTFFPSCDSLTADEKKLSEEKRDPLKSPLPLGPELKNICTYRESIANPEDSSFLDHNPDNYQFCQGENNTYYVIHPSPKKPQEINLIVETARKINATQDELRKVKRENDNAAKKFSEDGLLHFTILKGGAAAALTGALVFGWATHSFEMLWKQTVVSSKPLTNLTEKWAQVEYGQEIIGSEKEGEQCAEFSKALDPLKSKVSRTSFLPLIITGAIAGLATLYHEISTDFFAAPPAKTEESTDLSAALTTLAQERELPRRSLLNSKPDEEVRAERIRISHKADRLNEQLEHEMGRTELLANLVKDDSIWKTLFKWALPIGGGAATGFTFGNLVPGVHFFGRVKPGRKVEATARANLAKKETLKKYDEIKQRGRSAAIELYKNSCGGKEPPPVAIAAAHPVGLPIPGQATQSLPVASEQPAQTESSTPVAVLPISAEPKAPPISDAQADAILARRSWMGWMSDTVAPLKSFTNSIGVTSTMPTATGQFATAGWGASIRTFFTIRPAPAPIRVR